MDSDPFAALLIASAIRNTIDVGFKVVGKSYELHSSGERVSIMDEEWTQLESDLISLNKQLERPFRSITSCLRKDEQQLEDLSQSCKIIVEDLLTHFNLIMVEMVKRGYEPLKGLWGKEDVEALIARLRTVKTEFELQVLVFLRTAIDWRFLSQADQYKTLNLDARRMASSLLDANFVPFNLSKESTTLTEAPVLKQHQDPTKSSLAGFGPIHDPAEDRKSTVSATDSMMQAPTGKIGILQNFLLESLSFASMKDREEEVAEAHQNTFGWIFDNNSKDPTPAEGTKSESNFLQWLRYDEGGGIYWINGKAGSGKSTLMRYIYDHKKTAEQLQLWAGTAPLTMAGFFFWTSGSLEQRSQIGLLRYLLFQILQIHQDLIQVTFSEIWMHYCNMSTQERIKNPISWSLQQLMKGLKSFLHHAHTKMKIAFFIDGLDESDGQHGEIINLFRSITSMSPNLKTCLSSRPWPVFVEAFRFLPGLKLQDLTFNDMLQYVYDKLYSDPRSRRIVRKEPESGSALMTEIVRRADGVFLWITLVVRSLLGDLCKGDNISDLQQRLRILPTDLDALFKHTLFDTQPDQHVKEASRIFQLIRAREIICDFTRNYSVASLSVWELALADQETQDVAIKTLVHRVSDEEISYRCHNVLDRVNSRCAGLLGVHDKQAKSERSGARFDEDSSSKTAKRLAGKKTTYLHRTVRDFLVYSGVWDLLLMPTVGDGYDPHICHLRSYVLQLKFPLEEPEHHRRLDEWWPDIVMAMTHARYSEASNSHLQIALVKELNKTLCWYWRVRSSDPNDNWARNAFGSYEERKNTIFYEPFLSLAVKFGLCQYVEVELCAKKITYQGGRPLLSYATDFLVDRQKTIYPLSDSNLVEVILASGMDPNQLYQISSTKEETPWLSTLKYVRQAMRRGWITYYDIDKDGVARWVKIMELFIQYGANPNALIVEDQWDPSATALEVVRAILERYASKRVQGLLDTLILHGATERKIE